MKLTDTFPDRLVTLCDGRDGLRQLHHVKVTAPDVPGDVLDMVASDESIDRYNEVIRASGYQLDNYRKNPVIQNSHQYHDLIFTIGKAIKTEIQEAKLVQRWEFATGANPFAKIAHALYRDGFLKASSVGFVPMEWEDGNVTTGPSRIFTKQELLEVSAVSIPANPNALALAVRSGTVETADLRELEKLLQQLCKHQAEPPPKAGASGSGIDDAQWLRLLRAVTVVMQRD